MAANKRKSKKFEFDVALSFSGKNRDVAEKIKEAAESSGLKVFYDKDQVALMWGNCEQVYEKVYADDSRTVVPLVSQDYLNPHYSPSLWARWFLLVAWSGRAIARGITG
ncbi:hypothetical protein [Rhodopirellula bahusiensis]|uniref:hypothetical protein n=1 Tax=Rhodopirellula bahusiensis TaxID=2014065 RepID=UPI0032677522